MRFSFKTSPQLSDWESIRNVWLAADDIETFDAGWTFDHFYPLGGEEPTEPCFEGWTITTALAALTTRLRFGVMVLSNTFRHPAVLANMAATLDQISAGRLELGVGAGWFQDEHDAYGIDLPPLRDRFDRLDEALEVLHLLFTEDEADFDGRYYHLAAARMEPKPLQRPHPPIVIGGRGERRTLGAVARWADQWNHPGGSPEELSRLIEILGERCAEVGRDPDEIEVSTQVRHRELSSTLAETQAMLGAGADHVIVMLPPPFDPAALEPVAEGLETLR